MNWIVREHYPVAEPPEDLRLSDNPNSVVKVTVEEKSRLDNVMTLESGIY